MQGRAEDGCVDRLTGERTSGGKSCKALGDRRRRGKAGNQYVEWGRRGTDSGSDDEDHDCLLV